jgi:zinc protease
MRCCRQLGVLSGFAALLLLLAGCAANRPNLPAQLDYPVLQFHPPAVETLVLGNGIRLYLKEDRELPLVQVTALIGAGAINTPREKAGFADLFGSTWRTGGAGDHSPEELDASLDRLAADLGASMGPYSAQLDLSVRTQDLAQGVAILADMLRRPGFAPERLELARLQAQEQVRRQNDDPDVISQRLLMAALYPNSELGYAPTHDTLANISRQDLVDFQNTYFAPNELWLAVSGDFERDRLLQLLEHHFGDWQKRQVPVQTLPAVTRPGTGLIQVVAKDLPQTTVMIGDLGLTKDHPDQYAVQVFNYILGGGGFNSRMMREIRSNRGLAYSVYSFFQVGRRLPGPFLAGTETKNESVVPVVTLMRDIMTGL